MKGKKRGRENASIARRITGGASEAFRPAGKRENPLTCEEDTFSLLLATKLPLVLLF